MNTKFHPKDDGNFISKVTLWWIVDLLWRGYQKPLNHQDLNVVREEDCAHIQARRLEEIWRNEKIYAEQRKRKPKLWKAVLEYFKWKDYALLSFMCFLGVFGNILYRYSVLLLLNAVASNSGHDLEPQISSYVFVWGMVLGASLEGVGNRHFNLITPTLGIRSRAALVVLIYKKVLKSSKTMINAGEVMELICNDSQRLVTMADRSIPYFLRKFICCIIYVIWLLRLFGWKIIPGFLVFVFLTIFRISITKVDVSLRRNVSHEAEKRLGYLRQVLTSIISVKLNCLEHVYEEKIKRTRWQEIKYKAKRWVITSASFSLTTCGQQLSTFVTVLLLLFIDRTVITVHNLLTMILLFSSIGEAVCMNLPLAVHFTTDILMALFRIQQFLDRFDVLDIAMNENVSSQEYNLESDEKLADTMETAEIVGHTPYVWFNNVSCKLPSTDASSAQLHNASLLNDISLNVSSKGLVIITGPVGSGKSSMLASILHGELHIARGSVKQSGNVAYVSDTPWVYPGTVRENILFGLAYDEKWYIETVKACQLENDLENFPQQDLSRIGEYGATLSGGQRTRIALARAVYSRADIYLLDDPLSSLDAKVARNIFKSVIKGMLSERIVFLTTQTYLNEADYVVKLNKGMVIAQGTVEEVKKIISEMEIGKNKDNYVQETDKVSDRIKDEDEKVEQLHEAVEDREVGRVSFKVDAKYFTYGASALMILLISLAVVAGQGLTMWTDIQVAHLPHLLNQEGKFYKAFTVYTISLIIAVLVTFLSKTCLFLLPIRANYVVHNAMVSCLLRAPSHFFAVNPAGRILNRFSQDVTNLDDLLPYNLVFFFQCGSLALGVIVLCMLTNILLTPAILVTVIICCGISRFFFNSAMDIKRLMSQDGGPLYSHFSNTIEGLRTIRVHNRQKNFTDALFSHIDRHHQAMFAYFTAARWLGLIIDIFLILVSGIISVAELYSVKDSTSAVVAAITILYSFNCAVYVAAMVRSAVEVQAQMTSAERILAYTEIRPEEGYKIQTEPPQKWPESGQIEFKNVSFRYYKAGPKVLRDLSFQIKSSEKIGIVGRTGAGKSSLVAALMRISETEGNIIIDGLNTNALNLSCTRQKISVISQSPLLFNGSVRENLNPAGELDDSEIWKVLHQMKLTDLVGSLPKKLDNECAGGGTNFSVGQRQLLHLARVALKRNKIVVFDEATGKVDKKTAKQIHEIMHSVFRDCTVLTISHRLASIDECDKIMVLDQGTIVEFDKQDVLLNKEKGAFLELMHIANKAGSIALTGHKKLF